MKKLLYRQGNNGLIEFDLVREAEDAYAVRDYRNFKLLWIPKEDENILCVKEDK